ncbi:hypothetical protein [Lacunimicrobium album]
MADVKYNIPQRTWSQWLCRRRIIIPIFVLLILILFPFVSRAWHIAQIPDLPEPCDPFEFETPSVAEDLNARSYFQQAMVEFVEYQQQQIEANEQDQETESVQYMTEEEFQEFIHDPPAFVLNWQLGCECSEFEIIFQQDTESYKIKDTWDGYKSLASYFLRLGQTHINRNEPSVAFDHFREVFRAGLLMQQNGNVHQYEHGLAVTNSAIYRGVFRWAAHPDVTEDDLMEARVIFDSDLQELRHPISITVLHDYANWMQVVQKHHRSSVFLMGQPEDFAPQKDLLLFCLGEPIRFKRLLKQITYNVLSQCDLPFYQRSTFDGKEFRLYVTASSELPAQALSALQLDQLLTKEFNHNMVNIARANSTCDKFEVSLRMLDIMLLLETHKRRHLSYPVSFQEMDEDLAESLPVDPFNNEPFHYRIEPDGSLLIYSVGFNKIDDNGNIEKVRDLGRRIPVTNE